MIRLRHQPRKKAVQSGSLWHHPQLRSRAKLKSQCEQYCTDARLIPGYPAFILRELWPLLSFDSGSIKTLHCGLPLLDRTEAEQIATLGVSPLPEDHS